LLPITSPGPVDVIAGSSAVAAPPGKDIMARTRRRGNRLIHEIRGGRVKPVHRLGDAVDAVWTTAE